MPFNYKGLACSNILEYTRSNCSNTWKRVTKALCHYFVSSTKLLATGNLARDDLIKVVSVYWWYLYLVLPIPIRSDTDPIPIPLVSVSVHL